MLSKGIDSLRWVDLNEDNMLVNLGWVGLNEDIMLLVKSGWVNLNIKNNLIAAIIYMPI